MQRLSYVCMRQHIVQRRIYAGECTKNKKTRIPRRNTSEELEITFIQEDMYILKVQDLKTPNNLKVENKIK